MWSFVLRRLLPLYVVAVISSCAYQTVRPGVLAPSSDQRVEPLPRFGADGALPGPPVELAYQDRGSGPVVVLLHGSPGAVADFSYLLPHLTDRFRVLVPDLPGFGKSARWLPDYSVAAHARYVLAWLDRLGVTEFQVVGFSMGSGVALHLADLAPDRVRAVTLYGGIGIQEGEGTGDYHLEHAKYALMVPTVVALPELVPHFGALGSRSFRWTFFRNFWDTDQRPLRAVIERLRSPLLVLHGRRDALVPAWVAVAHHELHPDGELHLFPDSHFMLFSPEKTDRLASALVPFLERHRGPERAPPRSRVVWYDETGMQTAAPPELPRRRMWPAGAQLGVAFVAALVSPVPGCVLTGVLVGHDRIDPFAGWLGCLFGGLVRRAATGPRTKWALIRWPLLAGGLVVGVSASGAAVGWWATAAVVGGVALGRAARNRFRNRGGPVASKTGRDNQPGITNREERR